MLERNNLMAEHNYKILAENQNKVVDLKFSSSKNFPEPNVTSKTTSTSHSHSR